MTNRILMCVFTTLAIFFLLEIRLQLFMLSVSSYHQTHSSRIMQWLASVSLEPESVDTSDRRRNNAMVVEDFNVYPYAYKPSSHHPSNRFRIRSSVKIKTPLLDNSTNKSKLILFYNPPEWWFPHKKLLCQKGIQSCPIKSCQCSYNQQDLSIADGVIIDLVQLNLKVPMYKRNAQVWIAFGLEPPSEFPFHSLFPFLFSSQPFKSEYWRNMFNWTMTYRLDSDIPVPYDILIHRETVPHKNYTDIALKKRKSALWLVGNCNTQSKREKFVEKLKRYYNVDIFGKCGNKTSLEVSTLLNKYKFYLAFENSICFDYLTEKISKTYAKDINIIPIVRGGADYSSMIPAGTYINTADFESPEMLGKYLKSLDNNITTYADMLRRNDAFYRVGSETLQTKGFCDICVKLHNSERYTNHYTDIGKWITQDTCKTIKDY